MKRKRSKQQSFNFSSCDEQLLQLENYVMKPEPSSSCHTQANDKLKRTGVFSRANVEESFLSAVSGPKKTSAKIHRRNSASVCVQVSAGARVGAWWDLPLHPAEVLGEHRRAQHQDCEPLPSSFPKCPKTAKADQAGGGWSKDALLKWHQEPPFFHLLR